MVVIVSERPFKPRTGFENEDISFLELDKLGDVIEPLTDKERSRKRSIARTIQKMHDIVFSNHWEYFVTVTFDGKKVDRYEYDSIVKKYSKLLNNIKQRQAPDLEYVFVPEEHRDGAYHFHGLIRGTEGLNIVKSAVKDRKGYSIFNIKDFNLGFTQATKVKDPLKCSMYMLKYITADIHKTVGDYRKRYWSSKEIDRTERNRMYLDSTRQQELLNSIQKSKMTVSAKTVNLEQDGYCNTIMYLVYQDYSENQEDNKKAWKNLIGEASAIFPYSQENSMEMKMDLPWAKGE